MPIGRWIVTVLVLALLAGGGYAAFLGLSGGSSKAAASLPLCPPAPTLSPPPKKEPLRVAVKNATERVGLAHHVSVELKNRGFHITSVGNTVIMKSGVASVRYSADRRYVAYHVAAQIAGSTLVSAGGHGVVELDLGPKFHALATAAQARLAYLRLVPTATPTPQPTTSCRARG
jgi:LytR cell envelope-related transcriptional attenuator